jgi:multidrug efflux system membrane fusion protein
MLADTKSTRNRYNNMSDAPTPASNPRRLRRRTVWLGALVALLLLAGLGWLGWTYTRPGAMGGPGGAAGMGGPGGAGGFGAGRLATTVGVAPAEKADLPITLEALGTVTPQATVRVRAQVSGILTRVAFKEGQLVRRGDLLAEIDPRQYEMALQQAIGQRQRDEAQLEAARLTLERYRTLLSQDSIARQEVDTQAALVKQLEGAVVIDRANEGTARLNLGYTRIVAPISGRVGLRTVDVGNLVNSGDTNGVAVITQVSPIDVLFAVPQDQAGNLLRGNNMAAIALDRTRATVLDKGVFTSLDNQIDTTTGTVKAKARFDNAQQNLFPSQFVNLRAAGADDQGRDHGASGGRAPGWHGHVRVRAAARPHREDPPRHARRGHGGQGADHVRPAGRRTRHHRGCGPAQGRFFRGAAGRRTAFATADEPQPGRAGACAGWLRAGRGTGTSSRTRSSSGTGGGCASRCAPRARACACGSAACHGGCEAHGRAARALPGVGAR